MREEQLYEPVRHWLTGQGYEVSAEVGDCDVVARHLERRDEIIIVELKRRISMELIAQAIRRQTLSESVYVAVPVVGARARVPNARAVSVVLKRTGIGLILVRSLRSGMRVEVVHHPGAPTPRQRRRRRAAIVREIDHRYGEFNRGGQTTHSTRYTAYRQQALLIAALLQDQGETSPAALRRLGAPDATGRILAANHYGWFSRVNRGRYVLDPAGATALQLHREVVESILAKHEPPAPRGAT